MALRSSGTCCSVRGCTNNRTKLKLWLKERCMEHQPLTKRECSCPPRYSFHRLPKEEEPKRIWLKNLHLEQPPKTLFVCSFHFVDKKPTEEHPHPTLWLGYRAPEKSRRVRRRSDSSATPTEILEPSTPQGHRSSVRGADPVLSECNNSSLSAPRSEVWEDREQTDSLPDDPEDLPLNVACSDHDYCCPGPQAQDAALDAVHREYERLKAERAALCRQLEEMVLRSRFGLQRFAGSDEDIRFYTRFASYSHLMSFWSQIERAIGDMVPVTRAQSTASPDAVHPAAPTSLQPIDEFFLFLTCLSLGLVPEDLAHRFQLHQSVVIEIIFSWANFLYTLLGAVGIWLDEETVKQNMPEAFFGFSDTHIVLETTELRCHIPEHLLLHAPPSSSFITHNIFKGLIGMAPHGPIMFVSPLYDGDISDREMVKQSGLVSLLKPSMAVMVNKAFPVEDLAPCKVHILEFQKRQQRSGARVRKTLPDVKLRVHLENLKGRVKEHELFSTVIPFSLTGCINQLFTVACLLLNYHNVQLKPQPES